MAITQQQLDGRGRTLSFADDILIYRQGRDRTETVGSLQNELDRIASWCDDSGALINQEKAAVTWFSLNNHIVKSVTPTVEMRGYDVIRTSSLQYLGVRFDRSVCFREHVDHVIAKASKGL